MLVQKSRVSATARGLLYGRFLGVELLQSGTSNNKALLREATLPKSEGKVPSAERWQEEVVVEAEALRRYRGIVVAVEVAARDAARLPQWKKGISSAPLLAVHQPHGSSVAGVAFGNAMSLNCNPPRKYAKLS